MDEGAELQPPGVGPLSTAVVVDGTGGVALIAMADLAGVRARGGVRVAFQSYPTILWDGGVVTLPLRAPGGGVDLEHRDSRLSVGALRDGRLSGQLLVRDGSRVRRWRGLRRVPVGLVGLPAPPPGLR